MPDGSPDDFVWRGEINARVQALEQRLAQQDSEARQFGKTLGDMTSEMSAVRRELRGVSDAVRSNTEAREREQIDLVDELRATIAARRLNARQLLIAIAAPIIAGVVVFLVVAAITGTFHR